MTTLDSIAALLTIASLLGASFKYIVIRPLQKAIDINSDVLKELKRELERSAADRRALDTRLSALEEAHKINKERIGHLEEVWDNLKRN